MKFDLNRINMLKQFTFITSGILFIFALLNRYYLKMSVNPLIWTIATVFVLSYTLLRIFIKIHWNNEKKRELEYINKVKGISDNIEMHYADDKIEDLWLIYDEKERIQLIGILEKMPKGKRYLKEAIDELDKLIEERSV